MTTPDFTSRCSEVQQKQQVTLDYFYFEKNPLFSILFRRSKYPVLLFAFILGGAYAIIAGLCAWEGALHLSGYVARPPVGFCEDVFVVALLVAVLWGVIALRHLLRRVEKLLALFPTMLKPEISVSADKQRELCQTLQEVRDRIALRDARARRWHALLWAAIMLAFAVGQVILPLAELGVQGWGTLPADFPMCFAFASVAGIFLYSVIANVAWYGLATAFTVFPVVKRYADRDQLWITPNAADGQGGLSPIGAVAFGMMSVAAGGVIPVTLAVIIWEPHLAAVLPCATFVLVVTAALFWPLLATHDAMRRAKHAELERIALVFRREYETLLSTSFCERQTESNMGEDTKALARLDFMAKLERIYGMIKAMPVWPFDTGGTLKYLLLVGTPIITVFLKRLSPGGSEFIESMLGALVK